MTTNPSTFVKGLIDSTWLRSLREFTSRHRNLISLIALGLVVSVVVYSILNFPDEADGLNLVWAAGGTVFAALVIQSLNAQEFRLQAKAVGEDISFFTAQKTSVDASIANLLPLPGSFLVRGTWLASRSSKSVAGQVLAFTALCWIGLSILIAGIALISFGNWIGAALLGVGSALAATGFIGLRAKHPEVAVQILIVEVAITAATMVMLFIAFHALGYAADLVVPITTAAAGPLASAAGVAPGGLGLAELLTSLLATLVDTPATIGFLAASLRRVMGISGLALVKVAHEIIPRLR